MSIKLHKRKLNSLPFFETEVHLSTDYSEKSDTDIGGIVYFNPSIIVIKTFVKLSYFQFYLQLKVTLKKKVKQ